MKNRKNNRIRLGAFLCIFALWITSFPMLVLAEEKEEKPEDEYVTIEIKSAKDLVVLSQNCTLDTWSKDKYVVLKNDIDLSESDFAAIPVFNGIFDGKNHKITGFEYEVSGYVFGFFRYIGIDGVVKNLSLTGDVVSTDDKECVGGICGVNRGKIENCCFGGYVEGKNRTGGIAGINDFTGSIQDSKSTGRVCGMYDTGGAVGKNYGLILNTVNLASVNESTKWVEESDEIVVEILRNNSENSQTVKTKTGTDTGGIAGFSAGEISFCTNNGIVGYEHVGYNVGGIVGRSNGNIFSCTNQGEVYGKNDVGGIVGQMEPYISYTDSQSLRAESDYLQELIDKCLRDYQNGEHQMSSDMDTLLGQTDSAVDSAYNIAKEAEYIAKTDEAAANEIENRVDYVSSSGKVISDKLALASGELQKALGVLENEAKEYNNQNNNQNSGNSGNSEGNAGTGANENTQTTEEQISQLIAQLENSTEATEELIEEVRRISEEIYNSEAAGYCKNAVNYLSDAAKIAQNTGSYLESREEVNFILRSDQMDTEIDALYGNLNQISDTLNKMNQNGTATSDQLTDDICAINDQINKIINSCIDYTEYLVEGDIGFVYEDISNEEIESAVNGKMEQCTNYGSIDGDRNVGGIAGSLSIDTDNPDSNAISNVGGNIGRKYTTNCVVSNCKNDGFVTAKKERAGGIAGEMSLGVIYQSMAQGGVWCTEGDYVGGICGYSDGYIKNSYAFCNLEGENNIGGIAGFGTDLENCMSLVTLNSSGTRIGAIAGQLAVDDDREYVGTVAGNIFVDNGVCGVDGISYEGVAEPISYKELLEQENCPMEFSYLTITYRVDQKKVGMQSIKYGSMVSNLDYPDLQDENELYVKWDEIEETRVVGNLIIDGEYVAYTPVLTSEETNDTGNSLVLVEGSFSYGAVMELKDGNDGAIGSFTTINMLNTALDDEQYSNVRIFCPDEETVLLVKKDGAWSEAETEREGQYICTRMKGNSLTYSIQPKEQKSQKLLILVVAADSILLVLGAVAGVHLGRRFFRKKKRKEKS